ncbi:MAG: hypothetical protein R3C49_19405 [Planctomycetaceae bacterium]
MQIFSRSLFLMAVAALLSEGVASEIRQVSATGCSDGYCGEGCNDGHCRNRRCRPGDYCDGGNCESGRCSARDRRRDFALNWCGPCGPTGRLARRGNHLAQTACWFCNTKAFPDSGWAPPASVPLTRSGGWYTSYQPGQWYGNPGGGYGPAAPMVYQPTDTTQLGYSYARVPTWRPNPGMIPPVPQPSNFHNRICPCDPRCGSCGTCAPCGGMIYGSMETSCPTCGPGYAALTPSAGELAMMRGIHPTQTVYPSAPEMVVMEQPAPGRQSTSETITTPVPAPPKIQTTKTVSTVDNNNPLPPPAMVSESAPTAEPWSNASGQSTSTIQKTNHNAGRAQQQQHRQPARQKSSGGWFGLPSLSEMTF